ncbi:MAG: hypothetical protein ACXVAX_10470 [Pseudobdellovibrio sp.]
MLRGITALQFALGLAAGAVIACSPTRFAPVKDVSNLCDSSTTSCNVQTQSIDISQNFKIGSGKVDILFVNDNSASMSKIQVALASKFAGFLQNLDSKSTDYRVAITTTDLAAVMNRKLIPFSSGKYFITNQDSDRVSLFNNAIIRNETINCEDFIVSMFNTYGTSFQSNSNYASQYSSICPSSDTRGIYTANVVVSENSDSFMRDDANLNIILISNDNVRQGNAKETNDLATTFTSMMQNNYPGKYWDFNSIIVKDNTCKAQQTLKNALGQVVSNSYGPAISGGIGLEYANLSNSAARDIENNPRPRGQVLDICESNYATHFDSMATQISEESRMVTLKCTPSQAPTVSTDAGGTVPFTWTGDKVLFNRGYEGTSVHVSYRCYTGPT